MGTVTRHGPSGRYAAGHVGRAAPPRCQSPDGSESVQWLGPDDAPLEQPAEVVEALAAHPAVALARRHVAAGQAAWVLVACAERREAQLAVVVRPDAVRARGAARAPPHERRPEQQLGDRALESPVLVAHGL